MSTSDSEDTPETPDTSEPEATEPEATEAEATEAEAAEAAAAPKRRRRSRKKAAEPTEVAAEIAPDEDTDEVNETPEDVEAEEAAADVMLEADAEAEGEDEDAAEADAEADEEALADLEPLDDEDEDEDDAEAEAEAPTPSRRRRRGAAAAEPEAEKTPAPTRRRRRGERQDVVVRAHAKYVRSSARKARLVCDHIRGKSVEEARAILAHTSRAVARDWSKLLESAVANAENNHELVGEDLYVMAVHADEGPTIRRFRPRAMGRATRIRKRTSHLTILLTPKD
jgi:ribosomal protein L22